MLLYGCGGHSKVVADCLAIQGIQIVGVFDDTPIGNTHYGIKVIGTYQPYISPTIPMIISIGDNVSRQRISNKVQHSYGKTFHGSAVISPTAQWDVGTVIFASSVIQSDTVIGRHVIINSGAIIEHDCEIKDFVHISPQATLCGNVTIGKGTWVGAGAVIMQGLTIGDWCIVGAGAVVIENIPDYSLVMGVPGVIVKKLQPIDL
jgi:sugar O-acyltransferase (sialic acid O-acetyltransferase NeuD family)